MYKFVLFFSVTLKDAETEKLNVSLLGPHVIEHVIFTIFYRGRRKNLMKSVSEVVS